jgi:hypothetical protein
VQDRALITEKMQDSPNCKKPIGQLASLLHIALQRFAGWLREPKLEFTQ